MSSISEESLRKWTEQAQTTLQAAQKLCTKAETSLQTQQYELTVHLPDQFDRCAVLMEAMKRQHEGVGTVVEGLRERVGNILEQRTQWDKQMEPALKEFDHIVRQLGGTRVPRSLINFNETTDTDTEKGRTLYDFISIESITKLKREIAVYKRNSEKIHKLVEEQYLSTLHEPLKVGNRNYSKITKEYDEIIPLQLDLKSIGPQGSPFKAHNIISTILKENLSLENELVSILEMLTNHYDQCAQGLQMFRTGTTTEQLQVLQNDTMELPEVLRELNTVCDIVLNNEVRANKFLNSHLPRISQVIAHAQSQISSYRTMRTTQIPKIMLLCDSVDKPVDKQYHEAITQLTYHYSQFLSIYRTKYLSELHYEKYTYPRKFLSKLSDFLNETLSQLQQQENQRRRDWLSKYGEFIPKELMLPGDQNQPVIVQIITEGLEEIQDETGGPVLEPPEETELLQLLASMKQFNSPK